MYDRGLSVLEEYDLEVKSTGRGRGALICRAQEKTVLLREYEGSPRKLECQATSYTCGAGGRDPDRSATEK